MEAQREACDLGDMDAAHGGRRLTEICIQEIEEWKMKYEKAKASSDSVQNDYDRQREVGLLGPSSYGRCLMVLWNYRWQTPYARKHLIFLTR